jgi:hypothetical protein
VGFGRQNPNMFSFGRPEIAFSESPEAAAGDATASRPSVGDTIDDFGTNNQETNIEEGDVIVSDGENGKNLERKRRDAICIYETVSKANTCPFVSTYRTVYAAYGDYILVWNARSGRIVAEVKMPPIEEIVEKTDGTFTIVVDSSPTREPEVITEDPVVEPVADGTTATPLQGQLGGAGRRTSVYYPGYYKPNIRSLALHEDKLLVIVEGYGNARTQDLATDRSFPILHSYRSTNIRVYDKNVIASTEGPDTLPLKGEMDVNGSFSAVRIIDGKAHIVTTTGIDTYTDLVVPFERFNFDKSLTDDEYIEEVRRLSETIIPKWAADLTEELKLNGQLPNLARISLFQTEASGSSDVELLLAGEGLLNSVAQVFSLDLENESNFPDTTELQGVTASGSFLSSYYAEVYAAPNTIIIAGQGYNYDSTSRFGRQMTYLTGLAIAGDTTTPVSVGTVEGHVLNSYSIDVVGNILRIATTTQNFSNIRPFILLEDVETADTTISDDESSTQNYMRTVAMPGVNGDEPGTMVELGRVRLGKPNEVFTIVRYFDNIAYAATFERKDPFYALDLSDNANPIVLGSLDLPGFSTYLQSMNDDNSLILAIGQSADEETGIATGLQLTVFDARIPEKLNVLKQFSFNKDRESTYVGSQAQWDFKAIRYVRDIERVIIPVNIYNWEFPEENFDGFVVFVVNEDMIAEDCRVPEVINRPSFEEDVMFAQVCYYCAFLPPRSMIFDGNLMTVRNHFLQFTDLDTCEHIWRSDVGITGDDINGCCYY